MWIELVLFFVLIFAYFYHYVTKRFDEFKASGLPYSKPSFPFGSPANKRLLNKQLGFNEFEKELVETEFPAEKAFGVFQFGQPVVVINDEELAKRILIKDFDHFVDRRSVISGGSSKSEQINQRMMLNLTGDEWRRVRALMSGVFTSGKLKKMTGHIVTVGQQFEAHLTRIASSSAAAAGHDNEDQMLLEAKAVSSDYFLDAIATSGFGLEVDSFTDPDNLVKKMATQLTARGKLFGVKLLAILLFPRLAKLLRFTLMDNAAMEFFSGVVEQTYRQRKASSSGGGAKRNDIIDLIVEELEGAAALSTQSNSSRSLSSGKAEFEDDFERDAALDRDSATAAAANLDKEMLLVSNAVVFFFAGFDTSSSGLAAVVHFLIHQPEMQERVSREILEVLDGSDHVTFDQIQAMKYLDLFIMECTRFQTFIPTLERKCTKDWRIPDTNYTIKKDSIVKIYGGGMSTSEKNFVSPHTFNPDNFLPENRPNKFAITMFGQGPRNCIGMRYAVLVLKICVIYMLRKFRLVTCSKTQAELTVDSTTFAPSTWFKLEQRT